eukprot:CAMPEP_0174743470 /NCGR_PEP_ID=MMETSP1094-20130205/81738_1 /TAXON_ID=156173 /ORGANISM="Chrysochromulina brevifilum, Strain UTEX LB 985" /LENGTH=54 /DNA_ID=CAMNT_0015947697 /DNA_START=304 /DNA_END=464 /DNA_ORIENTATION=+
MCEDQLRVRRGELIKRSDWHRRLSAGLADDWLAGCAQLFKRTEEHDVKIEVHAT